MFRGNVFLLLLTIAHLTFLLHPTTAQTVYVNYSPALYLFSPGSTGPTNQINAPPPSPGAPTTPSPQQPGAPQPAPAQPPVVPQPQPQTPPEPTPAPPTTPSNPPVPDNHHCCEKIGHPHWACLTTQLCAFDDVGSIACCPFGQFCRGKVSYGEGAGRVGELFEGDAAKADGMGMVKLMGIVGLAGGAVGLLI